MTAGWVSATVRGNDIRRRLIGPSGSRKLAEAESWEQARSQLSTTFYGAGLPEEADRTTASQVAMAATVWQLRALAGWVPVAQGGVSRLFAAPFEIANIEAHTASFTGSVPPPPIPLGSLAVAWPRVAATTSAAETHRVLCRSVWGDPGGQDQASLALGLRTAFARRTVHRVPVMAPWARGALAVLVARELFAFERQLAAPVARDIDRLLGRRWRRATTLSAFIAALPKAAAWALLAVESPADLWKAEVQVAQHISTEAMKLANSPRFNRETVAGIMTLILIDLWWVNAAIQVAGFSPTPREVFDAAK